MNWYRPGAIVLQCGADSLAGDRLGCFNLSHKGHAACVQFVKRYGLPTLILGGGGYTIRNVARCWALETAACIGQDKVVSFEESLATKTTNGTCNAMDRAIPYNDHYEYYGPDYTFAVQATNQHNHNSPEYLQRCLQSIVENLRKLPFAPSVQSHHVPCDMFAMDSEDDDAFESDDENSSDESGGELHFEDFFQRKESHPLLCTSYLQ